ncbi:CBS domain-containing protein CBSCBSPB3-like [Pyrus ussuriensis x Pyrus communis]|uniref:CBS domain-containing protein CBSCBSPB3-like n=1 Tax=Pyrus ussuriensis x Pyrus communis TaxID=2448454 RepID=A0A5N5HRB6_9ROSA|nr:CBS domain-containing protein CBSCBSPB3-like [Pyrus ussuriensis x Pyrus communis]KAB2628787.1 CBS domain-containing protein CBSCBSPB3-like [Pyrus ussuriensis x Pyrus communis]
MGCLATLSLTTESSFPTDSWTSFATNTSSSSTSLPSVGFQDFSVNWAERISEKCHREKPSSCRSDLINEGYQIHGRPEQTIVSKTMTRNPIKAAEQGSAIAAAVEGVERQMGGNFSAPYAFLEILRDQMFKPSLSTIIGENTKVAVVSPSDPVYVAAKRMREFRVNSVIIITGNKIQGILTPKDILIDGCIAACLDVLQITHAAVSIVESSSGTVNDMANTMMQKFWDSALALDDGADGKFSYPSLGLGDSFAFKFEDLRGRVHRINCGMENLDELVSAIMKRIRVADDHDHPHRLFEDEDGDSVLLATDDDLISAVSHARGMGLKVLRLHLDFSDSSHRSVSASGTTTTQRMGWTPLHTGVLASAAVLTGSGVLFYLKCTNL